jgi:4-hydroxy-3-polyprenylbenzoate decarboxylase
MAAAAPADRPAPPLVVGITGASGAAYAVRLVEVLLAAGREVHLTISPSGQAVIETELGRCIDLDRFDPQALLGIVPPAASRLQYVHYKNLMAPIASGSFLTSGMVICPCSGSTLAAVAHSVGENLIHRAAEVHLKERRKLVVVPRETPLSLPQLRNMQAIHEAGAVVLPASPGFYHGASAVSDLVDFVVARICDQLGVDNTLIRRWGEPN